METLAVERDEAQSDEVPASRIMRERDEARRECARLTVALEREREATRAALRQVSALRQRADVLAEYVVADLQQRDEGVDFPHVVDLIEAAGLECVQCDGSGKDVDELMVGDPGDKHGYRTEEVVVDCSGCKGLGKVLR
jgi:hypothetical protein